MHIHLIAVCGTGMGAFAGMLKAAGHVVTGSDQNVYPPMSDYLREQGVTIMNGYDAGHLSPRPDLVVVGNAIRRDNPEARAAIDGGMEYASFPEALHRFFLASRTTAAVCGTHGKTTTTALVAWLLTHAGRDPSFLVGGIALNLGAPVRLGGGEHFVIEGDEYDTAFFDKVPKFLRYRPRHAILANVEFDHADIYPTMDHVMAAFAMLVDNMPPDGVLIAGIDCPRVRTLIARAPCRIVSFACDHDADYRIAKPRFVGGATRFDLFTPDGAVADIDLPMIGRHNVLNAAAAFALARVLGLSPDEIRAGFSTFLGIKRRQEVLLEAGGITLIDDFAHHPTAVEVTLEALRQRYLGRRLVVVFEPRTNTSRRAYFQESYARSFGYAGEVLIAPVFGAQTLGEGEGLDAVRLASDIVRNGVSARAYADFDELRASALATVRPGDVLVLLSNGAVGGLRETLSDALIKKAGEGV